MRVVDLDRDMSDVIPTGTSPDSEYLFQRMTDRTIELAAPASGRRILDVASGVGQDSIRMAVEGADVIGAEPSARMLGMAGFIAAKEKLPEPTWVRGWGDHLPFATGSFDAVICKGALDHFDRPDEAIGEMARVTRPGGRVVLAIANFESLACRTGRLLDELRQDMRRKGVIRSRRSYDCPSDHFTRYELELMREQAGRHLELEVVDGVSLLWGAPGWSRIVESLPADTGQHLLRACDAIARRWPTLADVVLLAGRPRRSGSN